MSNNHPICLKQIRSPLARLSILKNLHTDSSKNTRNPAANLTMEIDSRQGTPSMEAGYRLPKEIDPSSNSSNKGSGMFFFPKEGRNKLETTKIIFNYAGTPSSSGKGVKIPQVESIINLLSLLGEKT